MKKEILVTLATASLMMGCRSTERTVGFRGSDLGDMPTAAQNAVRQEIGNAEIVDVDKERRSGRLNYEVTYLADVGQQEKLHVTEDGRLLNTKQASMAGWFLREPSGTESGARSDYAKSDAQNIKSTSQFSTDERQSSTELKSTRELNAETRLSHPTRATAKLEAPAQTVSKDASYEAQAKPTAKIDYSTASSEEQASAATESRSSGPLIGTKLEDLPAAVQTTLKKEYANAEIADIDKETREGRVVYQISFKESGRNPKIILAEDGTLMSQSKFQERSGAAREPVELQHGVRGGAEGLLKQKPAEIRFGQASVTESAGAEKNLPESKAETSRVSSAEIKGTTIELRSLPQAVQQSIRTHTGGARIATIEKGTVYAVKFENANKPTLYFKEDGTLVDGK